MENKKEQEKSSKGEQKFAAAAAAAAADVILEAMIDGVAVVDMNGNVIQCNTAFAKMHGFENVEETIGRNITETLPEREFPKVMDAFKKHFEMGSAINFEFVAKSKNSIEFPALVNAKVLKDEKGTIVGTVATLRDITELKKLQEEAAKTKEATILDAMVDGVGIIDMNGTVTMCNSAWVKMFGYKSIEEALEKSVTEIITERDIPRCLEGVKKCFETGIAKNFEFIGKDKSGKEFPIVLNAVVLKDEKGEIIGIVGVLRDIMEIKKAQKELQAKLKELEDFHDLAVGRELKMAKLEEEIEALKKSK